MHRQYFAPTHYARLNHPEDLYTTASMETNLIFALAEDTASPDIVAASNASLTAPTETNATEAATHLPEQSENTRNTFSPEKENGMAKNSRTNANKQVKEQAVVGEPQNQTHAEQNANAVSAGKSSTPNRVLLVNNRTHNQNRWVPKGETQIRCGA